VREAGFIQKLEFQSLDVWRHPWQLGANEIAFGWQNLKLMTKAIRSIKRTLPSPVAMSLVFVLLLANSTAFSQETRGALLGTVKDAQGGVVSGAKVVVTNTEINSSSKLVTNDSGYFEFPYLLPGSYSVSVTAPGFREFVQRGIALTVNSRRSIDISLEVGAVEQQVAVVADAPMLETTTASGSTTLTNRQVMDLPVLNNSALIIARTVPGIQWTAAANYLGPHSNVGASAINSAGGVGGTEFSMDGVPNAGPSRRVGALPYADTVSEIKIESSPFDASKGHSSGATISVLTKSGTNAYHGSLTWQHWQQRWNATPTTLNAQYWGAIKAAEASGDSAKAQRLRATQRQETGRSNNWAGVVGGPVRLPWLYNGHDRLFFFFSYNGLKEVKTEEPLAVRRTVPTLKQRQGDFSELLAIDPVRYQIYDPRTARRVGNRVIRDPFPNNQVPILNPLYKAYLELFPLPNNVPGVVGADGLNNYLASATPFNWDFENYGNRIDWVISSKHRMFGKWGYQNFIEDRGDWTYETARGLHQNGLNRNNISVIVDHLYTINPTTMLNTSVAWNRYRDGNTQNAVQRSFGPDSVGLPGYLTERAGDFKHLPIIDFSDGSYSDFSRAFTVPARFSVGTIRGELAKILNSHSLRIGYDLRNHYRQINNPGNTSGFFQPRNNFVRQADNTTTAGLLGLEWAAFMLGTPANTISVSKNDSYYLTNPYNGFYVHDDWRVSPRLTVNAGLRFEREGGFRERFNRAVVGFDPNAELPITAAAQAAYAANPIPELPASQFVVRGGSVYLGQNEETSHGSENMFMPRIGIAYQWNDKTVIRGGWGYFFDTNNVLNNDLNQLGYSRDTATPISNDLGLTFTSSNLTSAGCRANISNCTTVFSDPFPVRADGTRFNVPVADALGLMAGVGRNIAYIPNDWKHARQQRWRFSIQRQLSQDMVFEFAYLGSYSDRISIGRRLDALPEQYWAAGLIRNNALTANLNTTVANPFCIRTAGNPSCPNTFADIQASNPVLYQDIASNSFFTATTRQKQALLRPFQHVNGSTNSRTPIGESKYHDFEFTLNKRYAQGMSYQVTYVRTFNRDRDVLENEFDQKPTWRPSASSRPHHFFFNALWEVPAGKGRRFFSDSKVLGSILGGWQVGAIYHIQSGPAYNVGNWFFFGSDIHDLTLSRSERTTDAWFNWKLLPGAARDYSAANRSTYEARIRSLVPQSVLAQMGNICGPGSNVACTYENVIPRDFQPNAFHRRIFPTRLDFLREDFMNQLDMNLARNIQVTEGLRVQFRTDFINALNNVHYQGPNTDITSANFGKVTAQNNIPRWIQFQFRLTF
jgi:hypothetical protein